MTVLRSRKVLPAVTAQASLPPATENAVFEPATPSKTAELLSQSSNSTTPSSSFAAERYGDLESGLGYGGGSVMVVESGSQRRHSARLALKVGVDRCSGSVEIVSGRKKGKVEGSGFDGEFDARNLEGGRGLGIDLGVQSSGRVVDTSVDVVGVGNDRNVARLGLDHDMKMFGSKAVSNGRRKRKLSMESKSLGFESQVAMGFLGLRSGKRVVKGEMEGNGGAGNGTEGIENGEKASTVLSRDDVLESSSKASKEELENGDLMDSGLSAEEKGKGKVCCETKVMSGSVSVNFEPSKVLVKDKGSIGAETGVKTRARMIKEEKGKMKLGVKDSSPMTMSSKNSAAVPKVKNVDGSSSSGTSHSAVDEPLPDGVEARETDVTGNDARRAYRERFRRIARQNASRFAHFSSRQGFGNESPDGGDAPVPETDDEIEDWPGPFSTAMKIIRERETKKHGERRGSSSDKTAAVKLKWIPKKQESGEHQKQAPSLQDLCLSILAKNANAISSLDFVPDVLRHKICWFLCDGRRMDGHFLKLLLQGSPTEIRLRDCSWLSEDLFAKTFEGCDTSKLMVLQLDQCGSCLPDDNLYGTLVRSPKNLLALTTISLKGAYRLSDTGLSRLVSAAPSLKSIDVSQGPLLTAEGICGLATSQRSILQELYLDECQGIDAMLMLPALLNLQTLKVLSVAGIQTVCDDFVSAFISAHGHRMKELGLADCIELTDSSLKVIGDNCCDLRAIDISNLCKLTDVAIGHLANGCQQIQKLKLCRNRFSDEAIAAYLDLRGACLNDLSVNNVSQVSNHTALSLARNCRNLRSLDISWCRNLTNEALGLIVDSCSSLKLLKLFGCTQVTEVFLDGHSNLQVKIIGLKMTTILKNIDVPDFLLGPL